MGQNVNVQRFSVTGKSISETAQVTYIAQSAEFTPPIIYSNESREKLVFMVEATFVANVLLRPGQPVDVVLP
jgi:HlyD family secretion protein